MGKPAIGGLYAVIDPARVEPGRLLPMTRAILKGGASVVQLRDKISTARDYVHLARQVGKLCRAQTVPFIVNDRVDVAMASGADGVHVGPEDISVEDVREILGSDAIVGASAGTVEAAVVAEAQGADYLGVGAIYEARSSKPNASAPRGPEAIAEIVEKVAIPVIGIGGIGVANSEAVMAHGAHGVAVISALMEADDPRGAAKQLASIVQ